MAKVPFVLNSHIDGLVDYVLDVKPYHTKLSEIVEEYIFEDFFSAGFKERDDKLVVLGSDFTQASSNPRLKVWANASVRAANTLSADKIIESEGTRRIYSIPRTLFNKKYSSSHHEKHVAKVGPTTIAGLQSGVYDGRRWDGPGVPLVQAGTLPLQEGAGTSGFHLSHGACSLITSGSYWRYVDLDATIPENNGGLKYEDLIKPFGMIKNISDGNNKEWTLVWDADAQKLNVSSNGTVIGAAEFNIPFVGEINFLFTSSPQEEPTLPGIYQGATFTLTPSRKFTIGVGAIDQVWTLVKVNPIAMNSNPTFVSNGGPTPSLNIFSRSLHRTPACTFTISINSGALAFTISAPLPNYPKVGLINKAFKDDYVHFAIADLGHTFTIGESFTFTVKAEHEHYLVYGSVSGWQPPAQIGKWYFNGQIGFKIPKLDYVPSYNGSPFNKFEKILDVHPTAQPSLYEIEFKTADSATVKNNLYGFRTSLKPNTIWADEFCSFKLLGTFAPGDKVSVILAQKILVPIVGGYDEQSYESNLYDMLTSEYETTANLLQEYFPLVHGFGCVITQTNTPAAGTIVTIDKIEYEHMRFRLGTNDSIPSLLASQDGWIPLEYVFDATFPNEVKSAQAYLASNSTVKVFDVQQFTSEPSTIVFDKDFFDTYIRESLITLRFHQASTYSQNIIAKFTDHLNIDVNTNINDALVLDSSGFINIQNYIEPGYFNNEDYAGTTTNF